LFRSDSQKSDTAWQETIPRAGHPCLITPAVGVRTWRKRSSSNSSSVLLMATSSTFLRLVGPRTSVTEARGTPRVSATAATAAESLCHSRRVQRLVPPDAPIQVDGVGGRGVLPTRRIPNSSLRRKTGLGDWGTPNGSISSCWLVSVWHLLDGTRLDRQ
jgi:hypothetical protein